MATAQPVGERPDGLTRLRDRFRCVALDFPGFGLSAGGPDYGYTAQAHADLLV